MQRKATAAAAGDYPVIDAFSARYAGQVRGERIQLRWRREHDSASYACDGCGYMLYPPW